ncbi:MAG TPA: hypothetical protein VFZ61_05455 [Polyangiales bacterium]
MTKPDEQGAGASWGPDDTACVRSIVQAATQIVRRDAGANGGARRDQHAKHHGCLWGYLDVLPDVPAELRHGVLSQPNRRFCAWLRFSNSSSRDQPDTEVDGRAVAIKLLGVDGDRADAGGATTQRATQDFILLNHTAFFAEDLPEMARIFSWLAAGRPLPLYFLRYARWRGLWAIWKLATRPETPLALTYHSQLALRVGPHEVKLRLTPLHAGAAAQASAAEKASGDHLRHVMQRQLAPSPSDRELARAGSVPLGGASEGEALFALELQRRRPCESVEIGNRSWSGPFQRVALLRIPRQAFDAPERTQFAEDMAFSVWNALAAHTPLGKLNRARAEVYAEIAQLRNQLNHAAVPSYDLNEWLRLRALPAGPAPRQGNLDEVLAALGGGVLSWPTRLLASRWGGLVPALTLGAILALLYLWPQRVGKAMPVLAPLHAMGLAMPSEALIPPAVWSPTYAGLRTAQGKAASRGEDPGDPVWVFRYGSMGAEFLAGIPYWIYRVLPQVVPEEFDDRGDWSLFGLQHRDDAAYYADYHGLPRGLVLSDSVVHVGNMDFELQLKRVALNCASCHRGEYLDADGAATFVDGMPNLGFDAAAFKRHTTRALVSAEFTATRVIDAIDRALAEEHAKRGRPGRAPRLNAFERLVYTQLVALMRKEAQKKEPLLAWIDRRPANGPGRLDAFSALRFEQLGFQDTDAALIATVDLPSIWRQGPETRPRHHYDGNTAQPRARNVGAIVGVGGHPLSIRFENVQAVADWIDRDLSPPGYPFPRDQAAGARGEQIYLKRCAGCHGEYDAHSRLKRGPTSCMTGEEPGDVGTDPSRLRAVDAPYLEKLNAFGERGGLWSANSFELSRGYLCPPLDGIWARAPYLHNGSVPTLDHLLSGERPARFIRGNSEYDRARGGFVWDREPSDGRLWFEFVVRDQAGRALPGNSAAGHDGPAQILADAAQRSDLIQYLYSL